MTGRRRQRVPLPVQTAVKALRPGELPGFFVSLVPAWEVRLPVRLADGTRALGTLADGPPDLHGGALPAKPTAAFFPHQETLFISTGGAVGLPEPLSRPLFVAGFTPRDLACLRFIDRFFATGWRDDVYFRQRQGAAVAGVSGFCGPGGSFIPLAGGECDLELACTGDRWFVLPYSDIGREIAASVPDSEDGGALARLREASAATVDEDELLIRHAAELVRGDRIPDAFWEEVGDRCIACTGCNLACPTCTCFGVQDWRSSGVVERSRMWDSCQLDGFMREASGHNPLGSEALRTRRRIHHKLAADPERWGEISCFLCGRCDAVCPTGIGIVAVAMELVERYGGK